MSIQWRLNAFVAVTYSSSQAEKDRKKFATLTYYNYYYLCIELQHRIKINGQDCNWWGKLIMSYHSWLAHRPSKQWYTHKRNEYIVYISLGRGAVLPAKLFQDTTGNYFRQYRYCMFLLEIVFIQIVAQVAVRTVTPSCLHFPISGFTGYTCDWFCMCMPQLMWACIRVSI